MSLNWTKLVAKFELFVSLHGGRLPLEDLRPYGNNIVAGVCHGCRDKHDGICDFLYNTYHIQFNLDLGGSLYSSQEWKPIIKNPILEQDKKGHDDG